MMELPPLQTQPAMDNQRAARNHAQWEQLRAHLNGHELALVQMDPHPLESARAMVAIARLLEGRSISLDGLLAPSPGALGHPQSERPCALVSDVESLAPEGLAELFAQAKRFCEEGGRVVIASKKPFQQIAPDIASRLPPPLDLGGPALADASSRLASYRQRSPGTEPSGSPKP